MRKKIFVAILWILFLLLSIKYWYVSVVVLLAMISLWIYTSRNDSKRHKVMFKGKCTDYDELDGYEFEEFIAEILKYNGFADVEVTKSSGDKGVDVIAFFEDEMYVIQCKRYEGKIGNSAVQEIYAGRDFYDAEYAVVCTNSSFTKSAKEMAEKLDVLLWDRSDLDELIDEALKNMK